MKNNNRVMKISELSHNFFYDLQSNLRIKLKERNNKRIKVTFVNEMDNIQKYFKFNNDRYLELINFTLNELEVEDGTK